MSLKVKGITAMKWSSFSTLFSIIVQLLQLVIVSHMLKPSDYGLIGMIMVVVAAAVNLSDMGISSAIIHRQDVTRKHLSSLYILNLATSAFLCMAVWLSAPLIAGFYSEPRLVNLVHWMSLLCLIPAMGQQFEVLFRKELKFNNISKIQILAYVAGFLTAFIFAYLGYGVYALVWSYLANAFVKSACLAVLGWRVWTPRLHFAASDLKGYLSFGLYQMSANLLQSLISNLDYLIIGRLYGAQTLGFYTFAFQLCIMPVQKLSPLIASVSLPIFARIQNELEQLRRGYLKVAEWISYLSAPIYFGLIITAPILVPLIFGGQWEPSILIIQILSGTMLARSLILPIQSLLLAKGRAEVYFKYTLLSTLIQVPGLAIGAYAGGIIGISIAYLIVQIALVALQYGYAMKRMLGPCLRAYIYSLAPGILYSFIMAGGVLLLHLMVGSLFSEQVNLAIQVLSGSLLYFTAIYYFSPDLIQNLRVMASMKSSSGIKISNDTVNI